MRIPKIIATHQGIITPDNKLSFDVFVPLEMIHVVLMPLVSDPDGLPEFINVILVPIVPISGKPSALTKVQTDRRGLR